MRLVHLSDLHLGYRHFQRQTPAGINQREADVASVFRGVLDKVIALQPDIVCIAGDVFHNVRPGNPAILHAFSQFSRLVQALPDSIVVVVAGNHDSPKTSETGCILRLFSPLGIHVVDGEARRLAFAERGLAILAVPHASGARIALDPDPSFNHNILIRHGELEGVTPAFGVDPERMADQIKPSEIGASRWSYVALGHHHVFREIFPNTYFCGAMDYTSLNIWGELGEEKALRLRGKRMIEFDLATGKRTFHAIHSPRVLVDLPPLQARAMTAADLDLAIGDNIQHCPGGIDDKIVRQVVWDVPRHVARELDHKALREYRRRALHFHLDARRPEVLRTSASGAPGRRASLMETVRDKLWSRPLPADVGRDALVELGLRYLREADSVEVTPLLEPSESE